MSSETISREKGIIIGVNLARGFVTIRTPDGEEIEVSPSYDVGDETGRKYSNKVIEALQVVKPFTRNLFTEVTGVGEDSYYAEIDESMPPKFAKIDDANERLRRACVDFNHEGLGAREVAEAAVKSNTRVQVGLRLGSINEEQYEDGIQQLANLLRQYYPRNFPANKARPRR